MTEAWKNLNFGRQAGYPIPKIGQRTQTYSHVPEHEFEYNVHNYYSPSLKFKRLSEDAIAPTKAHSGDLGYDLYAIEDVTIAPGQKMKVSTGISFQFPPEWAGFVKDRSSMATKTTLETIGGVIDNGYTGELFVMFANYGNEVEYIKQGSKIAQLILIPVANFKLEEVEEVSSNDGRDNKGFGSTGV